MQPRTGAGILRAVLLALSLTLAAVLIARGNVLVGGLIAALAVTRVALFVQMRRRRKQFRGRWQAGRPRPEPDRR